MTEQERSEWLKNRIKCITGTDIGAIVGVSPYKTEWDIWEEKTGRGQEQTTTSVMRWGTILEPAIAGYYEQLHGITYDKALTKGEFLSKEIDGVPIGGTPDYIDNFNRLLIEVKTSKCPDEWGTEGTDEVPYQYLCQVTWYMKLLNLPQAKIIVLFFGSDYKEYTVDFNQEIFDSLLESAKVFWEKVKTDTPPEITGDKACTRYLSKKFLSKGELVECPEAMYLLCREFVAVKDQIKKLEENESLLSNKIIESIGNNNGFYGDNWKITTVKSDKKSTFLKVKVD
jgi:putative phage-type endonuclease